MCVMTARTEYNLIFDDSKRFSRILGVIIISINHHYRKNLNSGKFQGNRVPANRDFTIQSKALWLAFKRKDLTRGLFLMFVS